MIGDNEQFRWRAKRGGRVAEQACIHVTMRANQRELCDTFVEFPGGPAGKRVGGE
jgi:hypothetical protein